MHSRQLITEDGIARSSLSTAGNLEKEKEKKRRRAEKKNGKGVLEGKIIKAHRSRTNTSLFLSCLVLQERLERSLLQKEHHSHFIHAQRCDFKSLQNTCLFSNTYSQEDGDMVKAKAVPTLVLSFSPFFSSPFFSEVHAEKIPPSLPLPPSLPQFEYLKPEHRKRKNLLLST